MVEQWASDRLGSGHTGSIGLFALAFLRFITLGGGHRDLDRDRHGEQAAKQLGEQDRHDQRRLEVRGKGQVITDGGLLAVVIAIKISVPAAQRYEAQERERDEAQASGVPAAQAV